MRAEHEIRNYCSQNRAEPEIRNYCSQNRAEHEIRNYCLQNRAEHEIRNYCSQNRAEHEIRNNCSHNLADQVSSSIIPSIINEVLNLIKIVMGSSSDPGPAGPMHDENTNTKFRTEVPKIVIASL